MIYVFFNVFDSFILVIMLKTFTFTFSVLFATHILPYVSPRKLKLLLHLSKLTINGL